MFCQILPFGHLAPDFEIYPLPIFDIAMNNKLSYDSCDYHSSILMLNHHRVQKVYVYSHVIPLPSNRLQRTIVDVSHTRFRRIKIDG